MCSFIFYLYTYFFTSFCSTVYFLFIMCFKLYSTMFTNTCIFNIIMFLSASASVPFSICYFTSFVFTNQTIFLLWTCRYIFLFTQKTNPFFILCHKYLSDFYILISYYNISIKYIFRFLK